MTKGAKALTYQANASVSTLNVHDPYSPDLGCVFKQSRSTNNSQRTGRWDCDLLNIPSRCRPGDEGDGDSRRAVLQSHLLYVLHCFDMLDSDASNTYDGAVIAIEEDAAGNRADFTTDVTNPGDNFYLLSDGTLMNDEVALMARRSYIPNDPNGFYYTLFFSPDSELNQKNSIPVTCSIDARTMAITCSSDDGCTEFYGCSGTTALYGNGLALAPPDMPTNSADGFGDCVPVTLTAQSTS